MNVILASEFINFVGNGLKPFRTNNINYHPAASDAASLLRREGRSKKYKNYDKCCFGSGEIFE